MKRKSRINERRRSLMANGHWWTIPALAAALQCSECGASARIRDQRKSRFGSHKIVKLPTGGGFEYRMAPPKEAGHEKA